MIRLKLCLRSLALAAAVAGLTSSAVRAELVAEPSAAKLRGNFAQVQLVIRHAAEGRVVTPGSSDVTTEAQYATSDAAVVEVTPAGRLLARGNGTASISVAWEGQQCQIPVTVSDVVERPAVSYLEEVNPILAKAGCNIGACHASQHGQAGFKLTVFAFAPEDDHKALVREREQRRINVLEPARSLILQKATMQVAHGGGRRLLAGSSDYELLKAWIAGGAPGPAKDARHVTRIVTSPERRQATVGERQQLRVEAEYSDGTRRDVTAWAKFDSVDDGIVAVTPEGCATVVGQGQTAVMIRFEGQAQIVLFTIPYRSGVELAGWTNQNFVDELAAAKFQELGIEPSGLCDDATFVRRAYLDALGSLPTVEETRAFLESSDPDKRVRLIERLLGINIDPAENIYNERYAAYWTLRWSDLIRNNSNDLGEQGMWALHNWIRERFRKNVSYDQIIQDLVTAKGSVYSTGPANYFLVNNDPTALAEATSQLFLGVRLECAKCHHHPFEKYSEDDYYGFAAFFARVGLKNSESFGLFGRERVVVVKTAGEVSHPRTRKTMVPTPLEGEAIHDPLDRRIPLATWLTAPDNEYFAKAVVNRYVSYLLGRGLIEPVDDLRSTNPASNPELLSALARDFVEHQFDLKHLLLTIMSSRLYQLDSQPTPENASDDRFYSHFLVKRLTAEPLLDAVDQVTVSQTKHRNLPLGTRAIELPDAEYPNYFLTTFAKPRRASVCECERPRDPSLGQALHTLNGDVLMQKINDKNGRIARLLQAEAADAAVIEELYLAALSRPPRPAELEACQQFIAQGSSRPESYEDLLWALMNSKEFLFVH